jgi:hypothetical protein
MKNAIKRMPYFVGQASRLSPYYRVSVRHARRDSAFVSKPLKREMEVRDRRDACPTL